MAVNQDFVALAKKILADEPSDNFARNASNFAEAQRNLGLPNLVAPDIHALTTDIRPAAPDTSSAPTGITSATARGATSSTITSATTATTLTPTLVGVAGGLQFNLKWDASVSSAPSGFKTAAIYAANLLSSYFSNPEVININVGFGEVNNYAIPTGSISASMSNGYLETYAQVSGALKGDVNTSKWHVAADASLSATDPTNGGKFYVSSAQAKAFGQISGTSTAIDGYVGLSSRYNFDYASNTTKPTSTQYDAIGAFTHEFTEVMGRVGSLGSLLGTNTYTTLDLFRYSNPGVRDLKPTAGYFSVDGGVTNLGNFNNPALGGDASDWVSSIVGDAFGSAYAGKVANTSPTDIIETAVIGYAMTPAAVTFTQTAKIG